MLTVQTVSGISDLKPDGAGYITFDNVINIKPETNILIIDVNPALPMYTQFLKWCTNSVRHVLIVTKKEEVWLNDVVDRLNMGSNYGTLFYLTNKELEIVNVTFIGAANYTLPLKKTKLYQEGSVYISVLSESEPESLMMDKDLDCVISRGRVLAKQGTNISVHKGYFTVAEVLLP